MQGSDKDAVNEGTRYGDVGVSRLARTLRLWIASGVGFMAGWLAPTQRRNATGTGGLAST